MSLANLASGKQLQIESKQANLGKTAFNLFDEIYINYPQVMPGTLPETSLKRINERLKYYCLTWVQTDNFKYEFLPYSYQALSEVLKVSNKSRYSQRNLETTPPRMRNVVPQLLFWSGDILAYQVAYVFDFEFENEIQVDEMAYVKTFYFNLKTGAVQKPFALFAPNKLASLKGTLNNLLVQLYQKQGAKVNSFQWSEPNDYYGFDEDEEDDNTPVSESKKVKGFLEDEFQKMFFRITPFYAEFILPPFCSSNKTLKQMGICVQMELNEFIQYLPPQCELGVLGKTLPGKLNRIGIDDMSPPSFLSLVSPTNTQDIPKPAKGTNKQETFRKEYKGKDSIETLFRTVFFDASGKPLRVFYGEKDNGDSVRFVYDKTGNLIRQVYYSNGKFDNEWRCSYSDKGNLTEDFHYDDNGMFEIKQYHYLDTLVYMSFKLDFFSDYEDLFNPIQVFVFNRERNLLTSYELGKSIDYRNHYHQGNLMGFYRRNYPKLDNAIYAYDHLGKIEFIISDNGRRLHEFEYKDGLLIHYSHYDSFRLLNERKFTYDALGQLANYEEKDVSNGYSQRFLFKHFE